MVAGVISVVALLTTIYALIPIVTTLRSWNVSTVVVCLKRSIVAIIATAATVGFASVDSSDYSSIASKVAVTCLVIWAIGIVPMLLMRLYDGWQYEKSQER